MSAKRTITSPHVPWVMEVDGNDLVIRNVMATCFGGKYDSGDNGQTESGIWNDGRDDSKQVALPIRSTEKATRWSPLAFKGPHIPWKTICLVWRGPVEENAVQAILSDNGPDISKYPTHAFDMNPPLAACFAPKDFPFNRLANGFEAHGMNIRIVGAAKYIS